MDLKKQELEASRIRGKVKEMESQVAPGCTNNVTATAKLVQKVTAVKKPRMDVTDTVVAHPVGNRVERLFMFSRNGNEAEVKAIIAAGADVNVVDDTGKAPLHYAAQHGHAAICEYLLEKGADVDIGEGTITPLHIACSKGHLDVVKLLISQGASIDLYSSDICTPLHYAAVHGHTMICKYLLSKGTKINILGEKGMTPLHYAAKHGQTATCMYLLDKRANVNVAARQCVTPLHLACSEGHYSVVKLLISRGALCNIKDLRGYTPLHYAAQHGHLAVGQYLLNNRALVDDFTCYMSPLHMACSNGHLSVVKLLIAHGATTSLWIHSGKTSLDYAKENGHASICKYLNELDI